MITRFLFRRFALLLFCIALASPAFADDRASIKNSVQAFYKEYAKQDHPAKYLAKSDLVTPSLKAAYTAFMKEDAESDPILQGQDSPESGYVASEPSIEGDHATLIMKTRDSGFPPITVHLIEVKGRWLIDGVNGFKGR
jgi:hypothetical protein